VKFERYLRGIWCKLRKECLDPSVDLIHNWSHLFYRQSCGIIELPILVTLSWIEGAGVTTAHCHNDVCAPRSVVCQWFRKLLRGIKTPVPQDGDDRRIQFARRFRPCRLNLNPPLGIVLKEYACRQAAP
jgi:hypothetical protein